MQDTKEQSFEKIMEYEKKIHEKNQQRIKIGIRLVIIIPLIFLTVMFKLDKLQGRISCTLDRVIVCHFTISDRCGVYGLSDAGEVKRTGN